MRQARPQRTAAGATHGMWVCSGAPTALCNAMWRGPGPRHCMVSPTGGLLKPSGSERGACAPAPSASESASGGYAGGAAGRCQARWPLRARIVSGFLARSCPIKSELPEQHWRDLVQGPNVSWSRTECGVCCLLSIYVILRSGTLGAAGAPTRGLRRVAQSCASRAHAAQHNSAVVPSARSRAWTRLFTQRHRKSQAIHFHPSPFRSHALGRAATQLSISSYLGIQSGIVTGST